MRRILIGLAFLLGSVGSVSAQGNCIVQNGVTTCTAPSRFYDSTVRRVSLPVIDMSQAWNDPGVTFTGFKLNITDTSSASASLLMDLQVGGTSKFSVTKAGTATFAGTVAENLVTSGGTSSCASPITTGFSFTGDTNTGIVNNAADALSFCTGGAAALILGANVTIGAGVNLLWTTDNGTDIGATGANRPRSLYLGSPSVTVGSGTGVTVNNTGEVREVVYKVTIAASQFITAGVNHDVTVATLPAKTFVKHVLADLTQTFACTATCTTSTLSFTVGKTAGGTQYLLSVDADAATGQFGDAAAELGASLAPATTPSLNGDLAAWSGTTAVNLRMTSGTGNIGTGAATNFSQGSVTLYITTVIMP